MGTVMAALFALLVVYSLFIALKCGLLTMNFHATGLLSASDATSRVLAGILVASICGIISAAGYLFTFLKLDRTQVCCAPREVRVSPPSHIKLAPSLSSFVYDQILRTPFFAIAGIALCLAMCTVVLMWVDIVQKTNSMTTKQSSSMKLLTRTVNGGVLVYILFQILVAVTPALGQEIGMFVTLLLVVVSVVPTTTSTPALALSAARPAGLLNLLLCLTYYCRLCCGTTQLADLCPPLLCLC